MAGCGHCGKTFPDNKKCGSGCALCGKVAYCNAECAHADWTLHQHDCNVLDVATKAAVVAVPHAFHDVMPDKLYTDADRTALDQKFSLRHVAANGVVSQRTQGTHGADKNVGDTSPAVPAKKSFDVEINGEAVASGNTTRNVVHTKSPGSAGQLAKTRTPSAGTTLTVPVAKHEVGVTRQTPTVLEVRVPQLDKGRMIVVVPPVDHFAPQAHMSALSRRARGAIEQQLRLKGLQLSATDVLPLVATDHQGRVVRLLLDTRNPEPKVVDVEYRLPTRVEAAAPTWTTQRFTCRPDDQDHVMGLLMAIRDRIDMGRQQLVEYKEEHGNLKDSPEMQRLQDQLDGLEADYRTVATHYQQTFVDHTKAPVGAQVSPLVRSAMYRLSQGQFQQVGAKTIKSFTALLSRGDWKARAGQTVDSLARAIIKRRGQLDRLEAERQERTGFARRVAAGARIRVVKKALRTKEQELQNMVVALSMKEREIRSVLEASGVDVTQSSEWQQLQFMRDYAEGVLSGRYSDSMQKYVEEVRKRGVRGVGKSGKLDQFRARRRKPGAEAVSYGDDTPEWDETTAMSAPVARRGWQ